MICSPALLYLVLCSIQIGLDFINGMYNTAFIKIIITIIITFILNMLCDLDLGFISWIFVLIPFLFMTFIVSIILYSLGYDAATGKSIQINPPSQITFQSNFTSPPIPPKFLPEYHTSPNNRSPIEENNIYLISYNPNQRQVPVQYPYYTTSTTPPTTTTPTTTTPTITPTTTPTTTTPSTTTPSTTTLSTTTPSTTTPTTTTPSTTTPSTTPTTTPTTPPTTTPTTPTYTMQPPSLFQWL